MEILIIMMDVAQIAKLNHDIVGIVKMMKVSSVMMEIIILAMDAALHVNMRKHVVVTADKILERSVMMGIMRVVMGAIPVETKLLCVEMG